MGGKRDMKKFLFLAVVSLMASCSGQHGNNQKDRLPASIGGDVGDHTARKLGIYCSNSDSTITVNIEASTPNSIQIKGINGYDMTASGDSVNVNINADENGNSLDAVSTDNQNTSIRIQSQRMRMAFSSGTSWHDGNSRNFENATATITANGSTTIRTHLSCSFENLAN
jgi:hypothetical protein